MGVAHREVPRVTPYHNNLPGSVNARRPRRAGALVHCLLSRTRCSYSSISSLQSSRSCTRYHLSYSGPHPFYCILYCVENPRPLCITRLSSTRSTLYVSVSVSTGPGSSGIGRLYRSDPGGGAGSSCAIENTLWIF